MTATVAPAIGLAAYLQQAELVAATTPVGRHSISKELPIGRSYSGAGLWPGGWTGPTAASENVKLQIGRERVEDGLITQIESLAGLGADWDGEAAAPPNATSIVAAVQFVRATADKAGLFEPTIHSDGSVLLEIDGGLGGSIRFNDDGTLSYAISNHIPQTVPFDGKSIPAGLRQALAT